MLRDDQFIGQQIDQFHILEHIGRGGMADVYLAQDTNLDRRVVVKLMLPDVAANEELTARFQREAQTTAQLAHPNIVQVYSIGLTPNGQPYLALQYISGGSLGQRLQELARREKWVSAAYALTVAGQMAAALSVAHAAGIVHRDLKPSNILLREDGTAVLSDLGIASVQQASTRLTRTGGVLGTPHYMSPEQAVGKPVDGRSDLYSLGVVLYELLGKRPPFDADSPLAIVHQQVYQQPIPLEQIRFGLAPDTYKVVKICLQKDPAVRYQTATELALAIDQAARAEGYVGATAPTVIDTPPLGTVPPHQRGLQTPEPKPKSKVKWILAAMIPIALLLIGYTAYRQIYSTPDGNSGSTIPLTVPGLATELPQIVQVAVVTEEPSLTPTPTETVSASPGAALTPTVMPELTKTPTATPEPNKDDSLPGNGLVRMTSGSGNEFTPALSPDQRHLAFCFRSQRKLADL